MNSSGWGILSTSATTSQTQKRLSTRLVRDHEPWNPRAYQERGVEHLIYNNAAALFLDPGLGKTSIVLEAFRRLKADGLADRMLVIAPLRVCQLVWRQEGRKWTQFRDLTFSLLHGRKKEENLKVRADIYLINPEGVPWLAKQFYQRPLPFDTLVIDELTRFKNHRAVRHKTLRKKLQRVRRRWGLTGTPAPRGYMDLFGQFLLLDDGAALGRYITHFRDQYFNLGRNGFTYELRPGSAERIEKRVEPYVLRLSAEDYLDLPEVVSNRIVVQPPADAVKKYREMKRDMLVSLPGGIVEGANSGAVYSKLKQMANGAVYLSDDPDHRYEVVHDAKLDALEELIEDLSGQQLLVAYEFEHDLIRLRERLGKDTPTLTGVTGKRAEEIQGAWNRGEIPVLLVHPASAGHGLNLQESGAHNICWFSKPWDLELYDQLLRRLLRQGNKAARIIEHSLVVPNSMDEIVEAALEEKDTTQQRLLSALNAEFIGENPEATAADAAEPTEHGMTRKLGYLGGGDDESGAKKLKPRGWGRKPVEDEDDDLPIFDDVADPDEDIMDEVAPSKKPRGWGKVATQSDEEQEQRSKVARKLSPPPVDEDDEEEEEPAAQRALAAFGSKIAGQLTGDDAEGEEEPEEEEAPKPKRARRTTKKAAAPKAEPKEEETPAAPTVATETLTHVQPAATAAAQKQALPMEAINSLSMPMYIRASIEVSGPPAHLAALFDAFAAQAREEHERRVAAQQGGK